MIKRNSKSAALGFTIIEAVIVLLVIGVIALVLTSLQGKLWSGSLAGNQYQAATLAQQQCAEKILSVRRQLGYSAITTSTCNGLPSIQGVTATVAISSGSTPVCIDAVVADADTCDTLSTSLIYQDITISAGSINPLALRILRY
jgi:Tfp pilus assembly protein PilV